jgi:antitoxin (DNA-binding transcriptional repressor) of toxin-antitoxin stability system
VIITIWEYNVAMRKKVSATEAVRTFSEILSHVHYRGDYYTVVRGGKPVASISPVTQPLRAKNLGELKSLMAAIPKLGAEADALESDIRAARERQPALPTER